MATRDQDRPRQGDRSSTNDDMVRGRSDDMDMEDMAQDSDEFEATEDLDEDEDENEGSF
jgi:hypothetical protein